MSGERCQRRDVIFADGSVSLRSIVLLSKLVAAQCEGHEMGNSDSGVIFVTPWESAVCSGGSEHDNRLGALHRGGDLNVPRLRRVNARVDDRRCAQNVAGAVPATLAVGGTPESRTVDVDLHVSESSQASCESTTSSAEVRLRARTCGLRAEARTR